MSDVVTIKIMLDEGALLPQKAHPEDAAYDLFTPVAFSLKPHDRAVIDLGVHMLIPKGYCGEIFSKSGLSSKYGITTVGLVDAGYTGSIRAMVYRDDKVADSNLENGVYHFEVGDKLTQVKISKVYDTELVMADSMPDTERGDSGFGSSGR